MGAKKKKAKKEKKEKKEGEEDEKQEENPLFKVNLPHFGWLRLELKLCDPPSSIYNSFKVVMRSNQSVMDIKNRIIDYHGRIENIQLYNYDPSTPRGADNKKDMTKKNIPPFRRIDHLVQLIKEQEIKKKQDELKAKKKLENPNENEEEEKKNYYQEKEDPKKFDELLKFPFPLPQYQEGIYIVKYDEPDIILADIFADRSTKARQYGTVARPNPDKSKDPKPPVKVEKKPQPVKLIPVKKDDDEGEDGEGGENGGQENQVEEELEEEPFIPPVDVSLWYNFDAYNRQEPILLALMVKGPNDEKTL